MWNPSAGVGLARLRSGQRDGAHKIRRAMSSAKLHDVSRIPDPSKDVAKDTKHRYRLKVKRLDLLKNKSKILIVLHISLDLNN